MYEEHEWFKPPELDAVLWRYMDFTKFVSLLETGSIYLVRSDQLGDPFEGSSPAINVEQRRGRYPDGLVEVLPSAIQDMREKMFISCWHENERESAAMWSLYARETDGIAIQTDYQSLRDSLIGEGTVLVGRVAYIDYDSQTTPEGNFFGPYLYKRQEFEHEREVRAVHLNMEPDPPKGLLHQVNLSILVNNIVVAPYAEDWFADLVRGVAGRYGLGESVVKSSLAKSPSW